jgi:cytochrome b561
MSDELANSMLLSYLVNLLLIGALTFFMVRHLTGRKGWFASFRNFSIGLIVMGLLVFYPFVVDVQTTEAITSVDQNTQTSAAIIYPVIMYVLGGATMTVFLFLRYADARRWFPAKVKRNK